MAALARLAASLASAEIACGILVTYLQALAA
jgi:hypothetical protein